MRISGQDPPEERRAGGQDHLVGLHLADPILGAEGHVKKLLRTPKTSQAGTQGRGKLVPSEVEREREQKKYSKVYS